MSSLASLVAADGPMHLGMVPGPDVKILQIALGQAGYRADVTDGVFTQDTDYWVRQCQKQHSLNPDGVAGRDTAAVLDMPPGKIITSAIPLVHASGWPHDDTASLIAFYGKPWEDSSLLVPVPVPFPMTFREDNGTLTPIPHIMFNKKASDALFTVLNTIATAAKTDSSVLSRITHFSGSYNYRPIRGSSRLSCHAFGAAADFDAEDLPLGKTGITAADMPQAVVDAFDAQNFFWGGRFISRKDAMHFQSASE